MIPIPEPAVSTVASDLRTVLVSGASAVIAALLTIILTPSIRHYFWRRQHLAKLRVRAADEIKELTSALVARVIAGQHQNVAYAPPLEFWERWHACDRNVRVFFSSQTHDIYKRMEVLMNAGTGISHGQVDAFIDTQTDALRALYREAGIIGPSLLARINEWARMQTAKKAARVCFVLLVALLAVLAAFVESR